MFDAVELRQPQVALRALHVQWHRVLAKVATPDLCMPLKWNDTVDAMVLRTPVFAQVPVVVIRCGPAQPACARRYIALQRK
ncbi:MAG TPA: hypothetical protein VKV73_27155 [Chloroflexota bacterium]|nr:hypothetical protein [Chloroflexota bacterium]